MGKSMNHNMKWKVTVEKVKKARVKEIERMQISWKSYYGTPQSFIR
jgi:hypothetical protein